MINFELKVMVGFSGVALLNIEAKRHYTPQAQAITTDPVTLIKDDIINSGGLDWYEWLEGDKPQKEGLYLITGVAHFTDETADYKVSSIAPIPYKEEAPVYIPNESASLKGKALRDALSNVYHKSKLPNNKLVLSGFYSLVGIDIEQSQKDKGRFIYWCVEHPLNEGTILLGETLCDYRVDDIVTVREAAIKAVKARTTGGKLAVATSLVDRIIKENGSMLDANRLSEFSMM